MYEALNERRHAAGLPDFQGHVGLHSKEFQQQRWLHGAVRLSNKGTGKQLTFRIDRWEAEPTVMSFTDYDDDQSMEQRFVPLTWEIC
jgi:hypothetical protein